MAWRPALAAFLRVGFRKLEGRLRHGNLLHADWTAAYHFTPRFALGATGYLLTQTTPDTGSGAKLGDYMSQAAGIGPAVSYTATLGGVNVVLESKWLHDVAARNRMTGDMVYGSFVVRF